MNGVECQRKGHSRGRQERCLASLLKPLELGESSSVTGGEEGEAHAFGSQAGFVSGFCPPIYQLCNFVLVPFSSCASVSLSRNQG